MQKCLLCFVLVVKRCTTQGGGRVVSASDSETSVSSSMPTSVIIYDAYTSIIKKINKKKKKTIEILSKFSDFSNHQNNFRER